MSTLGAGATAPRSSADEITGAAVGEDSAVIAIGQNKQQSSSLNRKGVAGRSWNTSTRTSPWWKKKKAFEDKENGKAKPYQHVRSKLSAPLFQMRYAAREHVDAVLPGSASSPREPLQDSPRACNVPEHEVPPDGSISDAEAPFPPPSAPFITTRRGSLLASPFQADGFDAELTCIEEGQQAGEGVGIECFSHGDSHAEDTAELLDDACDERLLRSPSPHPSVMALYQFAQDCARTPGSCVSKGAISATPTACADMVRKLEMAAQDSQDEVSSDELTDSFDTWLPCMGLEATALPEVARNMMRVLWHKAKEALELQDTVKQLMVDELLLQSTEQEYNAQRVSSLLAENQDLQEAKDRLQKQLHEARSRLDELAEGLPSPQHINGSYASSPVAVPASGMSYNESHMAVAVDRDDAASMSSWAHDQPQQLQEDGAPCVESYNTPVAASTQHTSAAINGSSLGCQALPQLVGSVQSQSSVNLGGNAPVTTPGLSITSRPPEPMPFAEWAAAAADVAAPLDTCTSVDSARPDDHAVEMENPSSPVCSEGLVEALGAMPSPREAECAQSSSMGSAGASDAYQPFAHTPQLSAGLSVVTHAAPAMPFAAWQADEPRADEVGGLDRTERSDDPTPSPQQSCGLTEVSQPQKAMPFTAWLGGSNGDGLTPCSARNGALHRPANKVPQSIPPHKDFKEEEDATEEPHASTMTSPCTSSEPERPPTADCPADINAPGSPDSTPARSSAGARALGSPAPSAQFRCNPLFESDSPMSGASHTPLPERVVGDLSVTPSPVRMTAVPSLASTPMSEHSPIHSPYEIRFGASPAHLNLDYADDQALASMSFPALDAEQSAASNAVEEQLADVGDEGTVRWNVRRDSPTHAVQQHDSVQFDAAKSVTPPSSSPAQSEAEQPRSPLTDESAAHTDCAREADDFIVTLSEGELAALSEAPMHVAAAHVDQQAEGDTGNTLLSPAFVDGRAPSPGVGELQEQLSLSEAIRHPRGFMSPGEAEPTAWNAQEPPETTDLPMSSLQYAQSPPEAALPSEVQNKAEDEDVPFGAATPSAMGGEQVPRSPDAQHIEAGHVLTATTVDDRSPQPAASPERLVFDSPGAPEPPASSASSASPGSLPISPVPNTAQELRSSSGSAIKPEAGLLAHAQDHSYPNTPSAAWPPSPAETVYATPLEAFATPASIASHLMRMYGGALTPPVLALDAGATPSEFSFHMGPEPVAVGGDTAAATPGLALGVPVAGPGNAAVYVQEASSPAWEHQHGAFVAGFGSPLPVMQLTPVHLRALDRLADQAIAAMSPGIGVPVPCSSETATSPVGDHSYQSPIAGEGTSHAAATPGFKFVSLLAHLQSHIHQTPIPAKMQMRRTGDAARAATVEPRCEDERSRLNVLQRPFEVPAQHQVESSAACTAEPAQGTTADCPEANAESSDAAAPMSSFSRLMEYLNAAGRWASATAISSHVQQAPPDAQVSEPAVVTAMPSEGTEAAYPTDAEAVATVCNFARLLAYLRSPMPNRPEGAAHPLVPQQAAVGMDSPMTAACAQDSPASLGFGFSTAAKMASVAAATPSTAGGASFMRWACGAAPPTFRLDSDLSRATRGCRGLGTPPTPLSFSFGAPLQAGGGDVPVDPTPRMPSDGADVSYEHRGGALRASAGGSPVGLLNLTVSPEPPESGERLSAPAAGRSKAQQQRLGALRVGNHSAVPEPVQSPTVSFSLNQAGASSPILPAGSATSPAFSFGQQLGTSQQGAATPTAALPNASAHMEGSPVISFAAASSPAFSFGQHLGTSQQGAATPTAALPNASAHAEGSPVIPFVAASSPAFSFGQQLGNSQQGAATPTAAMPKASAHADGSPVFPSAAASSPAFSFGQQLGILQQGAATPTAALPHASANANASPVFPIAAASSPAFSFGQVLAISQQGAATPTAALSNASAHVEGSAVFSVAAASSPAFSFRQQLDNSQQGAATPTAAFPNTSAHADGSPVFPIAAASSPAFSFGQQLGNLEQGAVTPTAALPDAAAHQSEGSPVVLFAASPAFSFGQRLESTQQNAATPSAAGAAPHSAPVTMSRACVSNAGASPGPAPSLGVWGSIPAPLGASQRTADNSPCASGASFAFGNDSGPLVATPAWPGVNAKTVPVASMDSAGYSCGAVGSHRPWHHDAASLTLFGMADTAGSPADTPGVTQRPSMVFPERATGPDAAMNVAAFMSALLSLQSPMPVKAMGRQQQHVNEEVPRGMRGDTLVAVPAPVHRLQRGSPPSLDTLPTAGSTGTMAQKGGLGMSGSDSTFCVTTAGADANRQARGVSAVDDATVVSECAPSPSQMPPPPSYDDLPELIARGMCLSACTSNVTCSSVGENSTPHARHTSTVNEQPAPVQLEITTSGPGFPACGRLFTPTFRAELGIDVPVFGSTSDLVVESVTGSSRSGPDVTNARTAGHTMSPPVATSAASRVDTTHSSPLLSFHAPSEDDASSVSLSPLAGTACTADNTASVADFVPLGTPSRNVSASGDIAASTGLHSVVQFSPGPAHKTRRSQGIPVPVADEDSSGDEGVVVELADVKETIRSLCSSAASTPASSVQRQRTATGSRFTPSALAALHEESTGFFSADAVQRLLFADTAEADVKVPLPAKASVGAGSSGAAAARPGPEASQYSASPGGAVMRFASPICDTPYSYLSSGPIPPTPPTEELASAGRSAIRRFHGNEHSSGGGGAHFWAPGLEGPIPNSLHERVTLETQENRHVKTSTDMLLDFQGSPGRSKAGHAAAVATRPTGSRMASARQGTSGGGAHANRAKQAQETAGPVLQRTLIQPAAQPDNAIAVPSVPMGTMASAPVAPLPAEDAAAALSAVAAIHMPLSHRLGLWPAPAPSLGGAAAWGVPCGWPVLPGAAAAVAPAPIAVARSAPAPQVQRAPVQVTAATPLPQAASGRPAVASRDVQTTPSLVKKETEALEADQACQATQTASPTPGPSAPMQSAPDRPQQPDAAHKPAFRSRIPKPGGLGRPPPHPSNGSNNVAGGSKEAAPQPVPASTMTSAAHDDSSDEDDDHGAIFVSSTSFLSRRPRLLTSAAAAGGPQRVPVKGAGGTETVDKREVHRRAKILGVRITPYFNRKGNRRLQEAPKTLKG